MNLGANDFTKALEEAVLAYHCDDLHTAEKLLCELLTIDLHHPQANYYLGKIMLESLRDLNSLRYFKAALEADPQQENYWLSYIGALIEAKHYEDAKLVLNYGRDAGLNNKSVDDLTQLLAEQESEHIVTNANRIKGEPEALIQEKLIQLFLNKRYQAMEIALNSLLMTYPSWLIGWKMMSDLLLVQKKDAKLAACRALALNQNDSHEHCYYGLVLKGQGDLVNAADAFKQAVKLQPNYAAAYNNLGIVTKDMGDVVNALAYYRKALAINPSYASCYSNLLFCLSHADIVTSNELFEAHQKFGSQYEKIYKPLWPNHPQYSNSNKCLIIAFMSADFREHSLVNFFEPVLDYLSLLPNILIHGYATNSIEDEVTLRLKPKFKQWHQVDALTDISLAEKIRADNIDILVDLDGHTAGNRLICFAMKPAPIQVSWLGYLATTGLTAMDYYFADKHLLPLDQFDQHFTEKIIRLSANAPFTPSPLSPEVNSLPALENGFITFGCFNRVEKISPSVIALWATLLNALPKAKLLLGAMPQEGSYDGIIKSFNHHGIDGDRLIIHQRSKLEDYLKLHQMVDICLDTFPSNGVTTTCHAAWMGVPTLCVEGQSLMSRGAMAIMLHLNLPAFVVKSHADFVRQAVYFSEHLSELLQVRAELRQRFRTSALNQPKLISDNLMWAFRKIWLKFCKKQPPISFQTPQK